MFAKDVAGRVGKDASRRRVRFLGTLEDLEGRLLLVGCSSRRP